MRKSWESMKDLKSRIAQEARNQPGYTFLIIGAIISLALGLRFDSSNLILGVTAIIILFYTIETNKMRKAITDNTELNTRPILVLEIDFKEKIAFIRNFSNFPAYNLEILNYWFQVLEEGDESEQRTPYLFKDFERLDVVPPKDRMQILDDRSDFTAFFTLLEHSDIWNKRTIRFEADILYDDVLNNSWKMTIGYSAGKVIATKPERVERLKIQIAEKNKSEKGGEPD